VHSSTWIFPAKAFTSSAFLGQSAVAKGQGIETHEEMGLVKKDTSLSKSYANALLKGATVPLHPYAPCKCRLKHCIYLLVAYRKYLATNVSCDHSLC
jgi:hypothetical protein